jgi:catechol 2,3-dioxygenase-like lactoylglutathione lyase family enzyme
VSTTATRVTKIGTVIIATGDQDAMIDFYVDKLGFEKRVDVPFGGSYRWVEVGLPGAETTIALAPPPEGTPTGGAQTGIALSTADADAVHADYKERGVDVDEQVSRMGDEVPPMFWLRDPEKNVLMVVQGA